MSLIYNICFLIGMNKKVKQYVVSNYFKSINSGNVFINLVCLLFIIAAIIICMYFLYRAISNALYMYRLKTDFYKLQDMGINVKNYNILYLEELEKKYIMNRKKIFKRPNSEFKNKNVIGLTTDKYIVVDFDTKKGTKSADFLIDKMPKDTVYEKTPNGYHYYFENDTGKPVYTYVQVSINKVKYSLDILGLDAIITMSPSVVDGKKYYWINSIFTHTPAKLSENTWILDLIKDETPFFKRFDSINVSLKIKNAFIIVDNINIENNIRFAFGVIKEYSVKMKLLNGVIYVYDDNYYFLTRGSFSKYKNKKYMIEKLKNVITKISPSCIIDLSIITSNYFKPEHIFHITSCVIDNDFKNYKYNTEFPNYLECNYIYKKTKYLIRDTITINNYNNNIMNSSSNTNNSNTNNSNNNKLNNLILSNTPNTSQANNLNKILTGPESIYITFLLSNYFSIPCVTLGVTYNEQSDLSDLSDLSDSKKQLKHISDKIINTMFSIF
jgi:hypothetical protein